MRFKYQELIRVPSSVQMVFQFVTDIPTRISWQKHLKSAELITEGPVKMGSRFIDRGKFGNVVLEVIEYQENKRFSYRSVSGGGADVILKWSINSVDNQSEVLVSMDLEPKGFLKVLWPILGKSVVVPQIRNDFKDLKESLLKLN